VCAAGVLLLLCLPGPTALTRAPLSLVVEDRNGILLGARVAADGQWRFPYGDSVCDKFAVAIRTREDRRFRLHPGIDPLALVRAVYQNIRARKIISGASTITMQVIRLSRPHARRTIPEKMFEAVLALRLELVTRKSTVLALYAAHAPFGGNVVGLEAASWRYFNRPPRNLSWAEAAMLAVLPNEPGLVHPGRGRAALKAKRDRLLADLHRLGSIDETAYALACAEPLPEELHPLPRRAPHAFDRIAEQVADAGGRSKTKIHSCIDAELQEQVTAIINRRGAALRGNGINNAAALVIDVDDAKVLAYAGNICGAQDSLFNSQVDCIIAPRSTGSVLKPFLYASMLDCGELLPTMLIPDIPTSVGGFMPQNFDRAYEGAVPASMALARSLNVPAVRMLMRYGVPRFHHQLHLLGMTTVTRPADDYGISIILGGAEGTLQELTGIYAAIARNVNRAVVSGAEGATIVMPRLTLDSMRHPPGPSLPFSPGASWCTLNAMKEVARPGEEMSWRDFLSSRRVAWKTGTSFGFRDGWAIGVTPRYAVGVWVGNASGEGRPGLIGISAAGPILFDIFGKLPSTGWFDLPEYTMRTAFVCRASGYAPGPNCGALDTIRAPAAAFNGAPCPYHRMVHLDATGSFRVTDACARVDDMRHVPWFVLPPVIESYYRRGHAEYAPLPPLRPGCSPASADVPLGFVYPHFDATVLVPRELSGEYGRVVFQAAHRNPDAVMYWHLDGDYLGSTTLMHQMAANPLPGTHTLVIVDEDGNRVERTVKVVCREKK
jgi:penicillin-binding protein 1C